MTYTDSAWGYVSTELQDPPQWIDSAWGYTPTTVPTLPWSDSDWGYASATLTDPNASGYVDSEWGYAVAVVIPGVVWEWNGAVWKAITFHVR